MLYFPEQDLHHTKIFFAATRKGVHKESASLDGNLEAVTARISQWIDSSATRHFVNEDAFHEHLRQLNLDLQLLLDHEMRNPLTVVQGYSNMLAGGGFDQAETIPMYQAIFEATDRALRAIDKLSLTMKTEFDRNSHMSETVPVEISQLASRVYADLTTEQQVPHGMSIKVLPCMQRMYVRGIRHLLHRAIYEVMLNAILHSRAGEVVIRPVMAERFACLDIIDNGRGIPSASRSLVFQRFYQDPSSQKEKVGTRGLGLGLYLARHIVEEHGGQLLLVPSQGDSGTTFRFIWPLSEVDVEEPSGPLKISA